MEQLLIHRKESIILDAIDEIDRNGIQAVSTREIAKKQGVSERVIFKYFPKKNDLMLAVLEYYSKYDTAIIETIQSKGMNPIDAIKYFIDSYSSYYENYPAITAITQSYDVLRCNPELSNKITGILNSRAQFIQSLVEEGKREGLISADTDSEGLSDIILGYLSRVCLNWRMSGRSFSLRQKTIDNIDLILQKFSLN